MRHAPGIVLGVTLRQEAAEYLKVEVARWYKVIRQANMKPDQASNREAPWKKKDAGAGAFLLAKTDPGFGAFCMAMALRRLRRAHSIT
jgi:hypothetical protein